MAALFGLIMLLGAIPLLAGAAWLGRPWIVGGRFLRTSVSSGLLCALSFNLTFLWQEIWLVIPKALTPGLHPILYHNNHDWTGDAPTVDLLQGTGAVATLLRGLLSFGLLRLVRQAAPAWRLFWFWMAFQGLNQALTQLAVGCLVPANDVGRALTWLAITGIGRHLILVAAALLLVVSGVKLARRVPVYRKAGDLPRLAAGELIVPGALSVLLLVPFREPRDLIEVVLIPTLVTIVGTGWLLVGAAQVRNTRNVYETEPAIAGPAGFLVLTLIIFQAVLRPGIAV